MTKKWQNALVVGFLAVSIAFILWLTLFSRLGSYTRHFYLPFSSYKAVFSGSVKALFENIENIILFIPVGVLFSLFFNKKIRLCIILGFALSLVIECFQWFFWLGAFEIDDLIHNTIGAVIGTILVMRTPLGLKLKLIDRKKSFISLVCVIILFISSVLGYYGLKLKEMKRFASYNDLEDGSKNLLVLSPDYSFIGNCNVDIIYNSDGSIVIEGSSENRAWIHIGSIKLKPGKYVLTGMSDVDNNTIALVLDSYNYDDGLYHSITSEVGSISKSEFYVEEEKAIRALISIYPGDSYKVIARPAIYKM